MNQLIAITKKLWIESLVFEPFEIDFQLGVLVKSPQQSPLLCFVLMITYKPMKRV